MEESLRSLDAFVILESQKKEVEFLNRNVNLKADKSSLIIDEISSPLIPPDCSVHPETLIAYKSTGDGNCLYNSASIYLCGNESLSKCLRIFVSAELYLRRNSSALSSPTIAGMVSRCKDQGDEAFIHLLLSDEVTVTVYIWMPNPDRFGHVSMKLSNGTYISWWPPLDGKKGLGPLKGKITVGEKSGSSKFNLDEDIEKENGRPNLIKNIGQQLKEFKMESWWADWSSKGYYEFLSYNCAWAVYTCLRQGGAPMGATMVWRPRTMRSYLRLWLGEARVTVYIWNHNRDGNWDVSMKLCNGTAMSWWPPEDNSRKGDYSSYNHHMDIKKQNEEPDEVIEIDDEDAMKGLWVDWSSSCHSEFPSSNCAWAVHTCLSQAGTQIRTTKIWRSKTLMTVTVYIWMPNSNRFGHVSMELCNGTYISWWSHKNGKKGFRPVTGKMGCTIYNLEEDIKKEKERPAHVIEIDKELDEEKMESWWADRSSYNYNCAWAVYTCLRKGGAPVSATIVWRPETMRRYLRLWLGGASAAKIWWNLPGSD